MAKPEENQKMAALMAAAGPGRFPNSVHLQPSLGWRGVGFEERVHAMKVPKHLEPSGTNDIGYLGGILAKRMGFPSPIELPME